MAPPSRRKTKERNNASISYSHRSAKSEQRQMHPAFLPGCCRRKRIDRPPMQKLPCKQNRVGPQKHQEARQILSNDFKAKTPGTIHSVHVVAATGRGRDRHGRVDAANKANGLFVRNEFHNRDLDSNSHHLQLASSEIPAILGGIIAWPWLLFPN